MFDQETIEPEAAPRESEADRVTKWRATELSRAGYDEYSAWTIAVQADVDLHLAYLAAVREVGRPAEGCLRLEPDAARRGHAERNRDHHDQRLPI